MEPIHLLKTEQKNLSFQTHNENITIPMSPNKIPHTKIDTYSSKKDVVFLRCITNYWNLHFAKPPNKHHSTENG